MDGGGCGERVNGVWGEGGWAMGGGIKVEEESGGGGLLILTPGLMSAELGRSTPAHT